LQIYVVFCFILCEHRLASLFFIMATVVILCTWKTWCCEFIKCIFWWSPLV